MKAPSRQAALFLLLTGIGVPAQCAEVPEANTASARSSVHTLAMLPNLQTSEQEDTELPCLREASRLSRVAGQVQYGSKEADTLADSPCQLPDLCTVKTGEGSWCEIQLGDVILRCWQNTECVVDFSGQAVNVKSGSIIVRKAKSGEFLITAGSRTMRLESGIAKVEVAKGAVRM